jgi:hypothetical protein
MYVVRVEPLAHAPPADTILWMILTKAAPEHTRDYYYYRQGHHNANH